MTIETFNQYYKRKLILWVGVGVIATIIRLVGGHQTSFLTIFAIFSFFIIIALIIGFLDYRFYEKLSPNLISRILDREPLLNFQNIGFVKKENDKLEGRINNYIIILSPFTKFENGTDIIVLIPLQSREGLDNYFNKYNDYFAFTLSGEVVFAKSIIKDYEKRYKYNDLYGLIEMTINSFEENKIGPLNIVE